MEDGLLSLKWNNHKTTFFDILRVLREKANYTDATIAVEGKFYPVHKLVMSTCSEYFSEIFERTPCKSPVIVLKDVRSQDMDALLDYMYLGEVNVNQNDLASLLKTAECLRIKGLAVPDEDPTKAKKLLPDDRRESPPPKKRRHEDSSTTQPPRPVSPSASTPSKTSSSGTAGSAQHTPSLPVNQAQDSSNDPVIDPPPMVKVEMEEAEDLDDCYRRDNSYEGGSVNEGDTGDFGSEVSVSKSEHDPENYGGGSYAGPSLQQGGDLPWEEGDSSSFPPEGFSGDLPAGQQPQGGSHILPSSWPQYDGVEGGSGEVVWGKIGLPTPQPVPRSDAADSSGRPHVCWYCGYSFCRPSQLATHIRIHTGEKPYRCSVCSYSAAQKGNMRRHMHLGVGGYGGVALGLVAHAMSRLYMTHAPPGDAHAVATFLADHPAHHLLPPLDPIPPDDSRADHDCGFCGKHCETPSQLAIHLRAHTGERPYRCPHCEYRATQKHHVKSHLQRRHKEQAPDPAQ